MRLLHRPASLKGLNIQSLKNQGFDAYQHGFKPEDQNNLAAIWSRVTGAVSSFQDGNQMDIWLALTLEGDDRVFPPPNTHDWKALQLETYQRESWYNNPNHAFYSDIRDIVNYIRNSSRAGSRLKGIRWNHEYGPVVWKLGSEWTDYAQEHAASDYNVCMNHRATEWWNFRKAIAPNTDEPEDRQLKANAAYNNPTAPWNGCEYAECRRLYRKLVDFQCDVQARMVGHVSDLLTNISSSLKLIVYPPAQGPTVHGKTEYTLDMSLNGLTDKPNIIWEMGDWDFREEPYVALRAWARQASNAGAPYFFTLQQSIERSGFQARRDRIEQLVANRFLKDEDGNDLENTEGITRPWDDSFGFWSNWTTSLGNDGNNIDATQQAGYVSDLRSALNEHG